MRNRLRGWVESLGDLFWLRPAAVVLFGIILGSAAVWLEGRPAGLANSLSDWVYSGGEAGARALLGAVASSTIGVAGTVFSITVAALSLASGQMGPRLLRNFTRDAGNQMALGIFLGTFAYALVVLRSVRSVDEGAFVPHLGVSGALVLAILCVATLIWFVHHVANGINVDTVIDLVHRDLSAAIREMTSEQEEAYSPVAAPPGTPVALPVSGYLRTLDEDMLADWAADRSATVTLLLRPGAFILPGVAVARVTPANELQTARAALLAAFSIGPQQAAAQDLEFAVRQLVEVAVRALSPGINDPFTAMTVLDRLGAALCEMVPRHLPGNVVLRHGRAVLLRDVTDYDGLCDAMFHMIRQNAAGSAAVLIRLVAVLSDVLQAEQRDERRSALLRHAALALAAGQEGIKDAAGLRDLEARYALILRAVAA